MRFGVEVNKYGSKTPISFRIYDGSYRAIITLRKSHIVLTDQSGSPVRLSRYLVVNERAEFELQVINGVAELFGHTVGNTKNSLHKWNLPINKKPSTIRLFTSGTGANSNIYHMYLENRVPLLDNSNNEDAHEFINFTNGEIFGVSKMGGGYGSQLRLSSTGDNLIVTGYGAGWVSALRSKYTMGHIIQLKEGPHLAKVQKLRFLKTDLKLK
ncbi:hypothetical protein HWQ46_13810 [Shewanella sp. D64]|uniref:hypothetical protein n=1 Tax=unclassified Shewanella TaxID=196818 RepID=UPI0022BA4E6F|nr:MULTISPECIES: hypothetical protein [unclassified Shewanella]MEC4726626.1 hypothetical protein [Shewanella sp. D64]MEC4739010.1 hypothetical protein [Shewanella sp. E94]WBJ96843.1 hypothetical protein HWQ47_06915 [Shewanella sp. MTB7]